MDIHKDRNNLAELSELYINMQEKAKSAGQELAQREKDDDAFGAPNKNGKKNGKKVKRWWDDDGDGKGYEKHEVKGKFKKEEVVRESGWHRRNPEKVGTPADPDYRVLKGSGKVKSYAQTKKENPPSDPKKGGVYKPDKDGKMVRQEEKVSEMKAISQLNQLYVDMKSAPQELDEKEVKVKDTRRVDDAIDAYEKSKKASRDATWDTLHGNKKKGDIEKKYAAKERGEIDKDDPKWKKRKYHTGIHGESFSNWRTDLREIIATEVEDEKEIKEKNVKNKVVIDPELKLEAVAEDLGAELISVEEVDGLGKPELQEKDLNAAERRALPDKDFALPGKGKGPEGKQAGSYPIPDKSHARMALAMVAKHGTPEKKEKVRAAVARKFPDIQQEGYKKLPVAKMAKKISDKSFKSGQSGVNTKSAGQTGKMIGVLDTHDSARSKAKSKLKKAVVGESREDRDPPPQFEKGDDDRGNPDYMKSVSYADEQKWKRLQRMRKASKKASVRAKVDEEKKPFPHKKVARKLSSLDDKMASKEYGFKRSTEKNRSMKIGFIRDAVKRGEDPRKDTQGGAYARQGNPDHDHRADYSDNRRKRTVKPAGVKEELVGEAKVDAGKSADEKATARNQRNNPKKGDPGFGKFATSAFIRRKEGQSLAWGKDSAASELRRKAHAAKRGVSEAKVDTGDDVKKETDRNKRRFGKDAAPRGSGGVEYAQTLVRRREHRAKRGVKEDQDKGYVVTNADREGNTPAYQGWKAGKKNVKTGKPLYKAADHLKDEVNFIKQLVRENDAYKTTVANLKKEFGDGVLASKQDFEDHKKREAAKPKPKPKAQKPLTADEKAQKEVDARYGRTAWNKKGSLGT